MQFWLFHPQLLHALALRDTSGYWEIRSELARFWRRAGTEEIIRQLFVQKLIQHYHIPPRLIREEYPIQMGIATKRADVAVLAEDGEVLILCEIKQELDEKSAEQLKSYMYAKGVPYGVLVSAERCKCVSLSQGTRIDLPDFPQLCALFRSTGTNAEAETKAKLADAHLLGNIPSSCHLDSVVRIGEGRFRIVIANQTLKFTTNQLFKFRTFHKVLADKGIYVPSSVPQKYWDEYLIMKLAENQQTVDFALTPLEKDNVEEFLKECTREGIHFEIIKSDLYAAYVAYCQKLRESTCSTRRFWRRIREKGYEETHSDRIQRWRGIELHPNISHNKDQESIS